MADISASYVSGNFIDVGAFGTTSIPGTWVSSTFFDNLGTEVTVQPAFNLLINDFVGSAGLDIGLFGGSSIPGQFAGSNFSTVFAYEPNLLPLTVGGGGGSSSDTRYWLS